MSAGATLPTVAPPGGGQWREALAARGGIVLLASALFVFLTLPLAMILVRSFQDRSGAFAGLANFARYVQTPALAQSTWNTLTFAALATLMVVPLAFVFAYAMQRSCIPLKGLWRSIALLPILAPSLLAALSFIFLFGNQGLFKAALPWLGQTSIYGLPGMVLAMAFAAFPHAVMILLASLSLSDARLYEAADAMGATRLRRFLTITLPGAKYGLISAAMVVFTMAVSEFGIPKVIGGNYPVLAIDIYKQVIGQQNFQMGAVVSLVLLVPAVVAFVVDSVVQHRQKALIGARSVPYAPRPARGRDALLLVFVLVVSAYLLLVIGMAAYGSVVKFWPYNLSLTLDHYRYGFEEAGVEHAYRNSLVMAALCALLGAAVTFAGAYWVEKTRGAEALRPVIRFQAMLPMAVPGMVLGIGYILFFNHPANPLTVLYGTMAILVLIGSIGLANWVQYARTVRGSTLVEKSKEYVQAARVIGVPPWKIMARHVLPNVMGPVLVIATLSLGLAILTEATLSFLGLGVPPTSPSLGTLIRIGNEVLFSGEWWVTVMPGVCLVVLVLAINLLGDWLRDVFNPKLK